MGNITLGEERFIGEAGREWKRLLDNQLKVMEAVPTEVKDKIENLYSRYKNEFSAYYRAEAEKGEINYSDEVLQDFDKQWSGEHPEFYDMNRLFEGCDGELLEKYSKELDNLQNIFR